MGNGVVRDLTQDNDTVYVHPATKQCTWEPTNVAATSIKFIDLGNFTYTGDSHIFKCSNPPELSNYFAIYISMISTTLDTDWFLGTSSNDNLYVRSDMSCGPVFRQNLAGYETFGAICLRGRMYYSYLPMDTLFAAGAMQTQTTVLNFHGIPFENMMP